MIRETRCVVLVCDGCREPLTDTTGEVHYETAGQARSSLADLGWSRDGGRDLCPACVCARVGHTWSPWWAPDLGGLLPAQVSPCRWCRRCHAVQTAGQGGDLDG